MEPVLETITISWDNLSYATSYRLYKSSTADGTYTLEKDAVSGNSCSVNSAPGTQWWFKVSAIIDISDETVLSLPDVGHAMGTPPAMDIRDINVSDTSSHFTDYIHIEWKKFTGEGTISGYNIYGCDTEDGIYTLLNTSPITDLYYDENIPLEGKVRYYKLTAVNEVGEGAQSDFVSGQTWGNQPAAPTGLSATQGTDINKVTVSWTSSADADGYRVYRSATAAGPYAQVGTDLGDVVTYDDASGVQGTHYFYKVSALKTYGGESVMSIYAEGYILGVPDAVTGVSATDGTEDQKITITWLAPSGSVTSYTIYRADSSSGTYTLVSSGITTQNFTDNVSDADGTGIHKYYKVSAVNAAGEGAQSSYDEGSTMSVPSAPGSVSVSNGSFDDRIRITWTASSGIVTGYIIYRCSDSGCSVETELATVSAATLTYDDMVDNHSTYYYMVCASNDAGEGTSSAISIGTTDDVELPGIPAGVTASQSSVSNIHISWVSVEKAGWYNIYRCSTSGGTYSKINSFNVTATTYTDTGITAGDHWFYKVTAENSKGESSQSLYSEGWSLAVAAQVTGVSASGGTSTTAITLSWTAISDSLHYHVYRSGSSAGTYTMIADEVTALTYADSSGIDASQHWYYKISAVNSAGEGAPSTVSDGWLAVSAPAGISATQDTYDDLIIISWNATVGASGYNVYRSSTESGIYNMITSSPISASPYNDTVTTLPGRYWYKITAINADGQESDYSSAVEGKPLDDGNSIGTPANIVATQGSLTSKVTITWNSASNAAYYNVYRSTTAAGTYTLLNSSNITSTSYDDTPLTDAFHYFYKVKAFNDHSGESGFSAYYEGWASPTIINPPTSPSATDGTLAGQITITWTASSTAGVNFYNIYRCSTSGGTYSKINSSNVTATTYTDTGITAGVHWFYKITADISGTGGGESSYSTYDEGFAMPIPDVPGGVNATDKANAVLEAATLRCNATNASGGIDGVTVTWSAANNAASYNIYRSDPASNGNGTYGTFTKIATVTGNSTTTYLDDYGTWNLNPATFRRLINVYKYTVSAVNAAGESAQSSSDEGSAQVTTAEFFTFMYDMPLQYAGEKLIYEYGGHTILPTKNKDLTGESGTGTNKWRLTWVNPLWLLSGAYSDTLFTNLCDKTFSTDYSSYYIYTNSIHNFNITLNGRMRAAVDTSGSGWVNTVNSSYNTYNGSTTSTPSEPPSPYWPIASVTYSAYLHVITVDANCYGWAMLHAYTPDAGVRANQAHTWVSYRGQRPVLMNKTSLSGFYKENNCP